MNAHITQSLQLKRARRAAFAPFVMPLRLPSFSQVPGALMFCALLGALALPNIAAAEFVFDAKDMRDLSDASPGDSLCATVENTCTLRAAIEEISASSLPGSSCGVFDFANRVILSPGVYTLANEKPAIEIGRSDRDVCVYIVGTADGATVINGNSTKGHEGTADDERPERVFFIGPRGRVSLNGVTLTQGHYHTTGGGAIRNWGDLAIYNSLLTKNSTHGRGGAIYNTGNLWMLQSTFSDNWARPNTLPDFEPDGQPDTDIDGDGISDQIAGGALVNVGGSVYMQNVTISGNKGGGFNPHTNRDSRGDGGGGILNVKGGVLGMNNSTVAYNETSKSSNGGGIYNDRLSSVNIWNTIVAKNTSVEKPEVPNDCKGTLGSFGYNLVGAETIGGCIINHGPGDQSGSSGSPLDPLLGVLTIKNGGPTPTHALLDGSRAIDAGNPDPAGNGACAEHDQRYVARPQDGPVRGIFDVQAICDIGAYELRPSELSVGDVEVTEGNSGEKNMVFELRLSHPSIEPISVSYETGNGSAKVGSDYYGASGTTTFSPGNVWVKIYVRVLGDSTPEEDEDLFFYIISTTGLVKVPDTWAVGKIKNDD
jgi:hypothetical protein